MQNLMGGGGGGGEDFPQLDNWLLHGLNDAFLEYTTNCSKKVCKGVKDKLQKTIKLISGMFKGFSRSKIVSIGCQFNKLTSFIYVPLVLLITNFIITLSK